MLVSVVMVSFVKVINKVLAFVCTLSAAAEVILILIILNGHDFLYLHFSFAKKPPRYYNELAPLSTFQNGNSECFFRKRSEQTFRFVLHTFTFSKKIVNTILFFTLGLDLESKPQSTILESEFIPTNPADQQKRIRKILVEGLQF